MVTFEQLQNKQEKICVVGLGYVGLPLAVLLSKYFSVIGLDINKKKIDELNRGIESMGEVDASTLKIGDIEYTADSNAVARAKYIIVAVPTPVDEFNQPDLFLVEKATEMIGQHLQEGSIVVYESTVYPGVTEEVCLPILEKISGLKGGQGFWVGYSPERVNPGDKLHTIDKVVKVVSGMDAVSLDLVAKVYGELTTVHRATSIRVAEAAKVIENTQRDLNIALMNELAILFHKMGFSVYDVLAAAKTKWNFLPFEPGLVGGHCIGVDPYYLTYKAQAVGHHPEVILAGRHINDSMHKYIAHEIIKEAVRSGKDVNQLKFVMLGITFKENVTDVRNSKVALLHKELVDFGVECAVYDPVASDGDIHHEYGIEMSTKESLPKADVLIVAVGHDEFRKMSPQELKDMMTENALLVDMKHIYNQKEIEESGIKYWSL